jgi:Ribbon-helix-helix domain
MSKVQRKPALPPSFNANAFEQTNTGDLLATQTVNQLAAIVTGQPIAQPEPPAKASEPIKKSYGRPIKEVAVGRDRFTTRLRPEYVEDLKRLAARRRITVADLVEEIISVYVDENRI